MNEREEEIISDLLQNYPRLKSTYFAKKYNVEWLYIRKLIKRKKMGNPRKETLEEIRPKMLKEYIDSGSTITLGDLCKKYRVSPQTILKIFAEENVWRREIGSWAKKYECNENYFAEIDCPEKAYWIGFIAADGYLSDQKLGIALCVEDQHHLELLQKALNSNFDFFYYRNAVQLWVGRKGVYNDLKRHGITERKTYTLDGSIFDKIPKEYVGAFCLGYFDGDGCFGVNFKRLREKNSYSLTMSLIGNKDFLERFAKELSGLTGISFPSIFRARRTRQSYILGKSLGLENAKKIYKVFYDSENSSKHFLVRKEERIRNKIKHGP